MKKLAFLFILSIGCLAHSQSYKNLNKYRGFKEIEINKHISEYRYNTEKIVKNPNQIYSMMPITDDDVFLYSSNTTKTIFNLEILNVFLVTNKAGLITQILVAPRKPDNSKQILNFYQSEFGKPYEMEDNGGNKVYLWSGDELILRIKYYNFKSNTNLYATIEYLVSFNKAREDK